MMKLWVINMKSRFVVFGASHSEGVSKTGAPYLIPV
ncbi:hypothetical protein GNX67_17975, partial [Vibrio cholerae]|nr:hypothetical protein [Vibrio cholerae]EGQ8632153.1 hypothetical protein [Vibrio cholerae]EGR1060999.1 hypothetical protein [Vibrio cholerae]